MDEKDDHQKTNGFQNEEFVGSTELYGADPGIFFDLYLVQNQHKTNPRITRNSDLFCLLHPDKLKNGMDSKNMFLML